MVASSSAFRAGSAALLRAVARPSSPVPPCPDLDDRSPDGVAASLEWLRAALTDEDVAEALEHASPSLTTRARELCAAKAPSSRGVRRAALSVARYLLRAQHRATPFGLFAGVATVGFGSQVRADWGEEHVGVTRADAGWLSALVDRLESCPELLERLPLVVNNTVVMRGGRLVVPFQPSRQDDQRSYAVEASLALTKPVRWVLEASRVPVPFAALVAGLVVEFPDAGAVKVRRLLTELVQQHVLITGLRAPSTETDALAYLLAQLDGVEAGSVAPVGDTVRQLRSIAVDLEDSTSASRGRVTARMRGLMPGFRRHPLALDLRLDAQVILPATVAREAERAALVLARLSARPYGSVAWHDYHQRFYERYGVGTLVPLSEVIADNGTGFPAGYPGVEAKERRPRLSARDDHLVRLAQSAALDGRDEVVLTEELVAALESGPEEPRLPPHLEVGTRVLASDLEALREGRFRLEIVSVSRGVGVTTGRFLGVLAPADRQALAAELGDLPTADGETVPAQLSFPPLRPESAHVVRAPCVLPKVISLQEHRATDDGVLTPDDLAVGCDGRRMYLAAPKSGHRVEPVGMHALNLRGHTPPLARFLIELSRAQCAQVTVFDWGAAAAMPFLPRLRYGRTVLSPARWRLESNELPDGSRSRDKWDRAFAEWRNRRRLPDRVQLLEDDRGLLLDLQEAGHRTLLRQHLDRVRLAVLVEAPEPEAYGWCGGRAHEVVVPVRASRPPQWPPLPAPTRARSLSPLQRQTPAASSVLLAALYGDPRRQDAVLARYLPVLMDELDDPPWWFIRFRDPDQHLRVRIALPHPEAFGDTARVVSQWANGLRADGLLADLRYPTSYREMGRWGSGAAWEAAEQVFRADSTAVLGQLRQQHRAQQRVPVAAHMVAITCAFLGSVEAGTRWLIAHVPPTAPVPVPRPQFAEAVRLADPSDDWAALRSAPGGDAIVSAWSDRSTALAAYRKHLPGPNTQGIAIDDVLTSLLHVHFVRHVAVNFPEEEVCLYLARAAAMAVTHRAAGSSA